jgi:hypothetical protein
LGPEVAEESDAVKHSARKVEERLDTSGEGDVGKLADTDEIERKSCGRNKLGFDAPGGPEETDLCRVGIAKFPGDGKRGDDVAAGASTGD